MLIGFKDLDEDEIVKKVWFSSRNLEVHTNDYDKLQEEGKFLLVWLSKIN